MQNKKLRNVLIVIGSIFGLIFSTVKILVTDFTNHTPEYTRNVKGIKVNLLTSKFGVVDWSLSYKKPSKIENSLKKNGVYLDIEKIGKDIEVTMSNLQICRTIVDCSKSVSGFLTAAIVAETISSRNIEFVINENGLTGVIIRKSLL